MYSSAYVWAKVLSNMEERLGAVTVSAWFDDAEVVELTDDQLILYSSSDFRREIIKKRCTEYIQDALKEIFNSDAKLVVFGDEELNAYKNRSAQPSTSMDFNPQFSFDSFIVGPSNRFAHGAAIAVTNHPGEVYNPLFLYGPAGVGKTHLLYAIANGIRKRKPDAKVVYIKGDEFTNELIAAIQSGKNIEFRSKYREADLFLIDDIQFIAGKESTQEEFFHTFNNLYESGKQIVLTSDRPPSEMTLLDDRLRTRFEWGLLADVTPPDFETRLAIVKNKAAALGMELPDKIASYIAENVTANVRQLEGTVNKILAYKDLLGSEADEATVTRAMQDILKKSNEYIPTPDNILDYISKYYGIEKEIICGQQRVKDAVAARQIAMYLIRGMTNLPVVEIGKVFDNRDHSTVLYSLKQVEKQMKKDPAFAETVKEIKTNINNRH